MCAIKGCNAPNRFRQSLCEVHWMQVPWRVRRAISKVFRENDMQPSNLHTELEHKAISLVYKRIRNEERTAKIDASRGFRE